MTGGRSFVTDRPVAISMLMIAMAVFGVVSLSKLQVDLLPDINYPTMTVRTSWPGAAPEDVESRVSERIQEALSTLPNLVRQSSVSRAGVSDVVLDFDWGTSMTFAVQDARERLDGVFLPRGAERPLILRYDPNLDPILRIGVTRPEDAEVELDAESALIHLRWVSERRIKRELETTEGVAAVQVRGGLEEEVRVRVDPHQLAGHRIDPAELAQRLAEENINASGGSLLEGSTEYLVRTLNEFHDIEEIADLPVARRGGATIRIRDVAVVERTHREREVVTEIDGDEAVEIAIYREAGANAVQVSKRVKAALFGTPAQRAFAEEKARETEEEGEPAFVADVGERDQLDFLAWRYRDEARFEELSDQSVFIEDAVDDVKSAALLGSLFAIGVIWVFLRRLSATLIIGVAIPISIVVTFAPMYLAGVSLNIMSLGGLALGVGMLVDNAIVVLESITRCREEGDGLAAAAVRGAREVRGAVTASTLTTIAVFAPIVFVTGIAGQIFGDQALTVVASLVVSLIVAVLFIPMLAARPLLAERPPRPAEERARRGLLAGIGERVRREAQVVAREARGIAAIERWTALDLVPNLLVVAGRSLLFLAGLAIRLVLLLLSPLAVAGWLLTRLVSLVYGAVWTVVEAVYDRALRFALAQPVLLVAAAGVLCWQALERTDRLGVELLPEIHQGEFTAHVELSVGTPLETTRAVLEELDQRIARLDRVATTALTAGVEPEALTREIEGSHTGRLTVLMERAGHSPEVEEDLALDVREVLASHPAVASVEIVRPTPFALDAPIAVEIKGYELAKLESVAAEVHDRLLGVEGIRDLRTTVRPGHPEALVTFDREKTLEYGLDLAAVSNLVRDQVLGNVTTRFVEGDERIDVRVIGDEEVLSSLDDVLAMVVNPAAPTPVPLGSVAEVRTVQGPAEIRRIGNSRAVVVSAATQGLALGSVTERIEAALADLSVPDDVVVELGGQKRDMDEAQASMRFALLLAVFLVYVVMASQFESLVQPLIILLTVPLAAVGVVFVLDWLAIPLSVVVFIGFIMLAGIVVNNAIVLVDRINQKRAAGLDVPDAILEAGLARLRPILMTTATTALGLLPLTGWLEGIPVIGELGAGEGAEIRAPMAVTVITGLLSSTVLTLVVVPTVYAVVVRRSLVGVRAGAAGAGGERA